MSLPQMLANWYILDSSKVNAINMNIQLSREIYISKMVMQLTNEAKLEMCPQDTDAPAKCAVFIKGP